MNALVSDLRHAVRRLVKAPGFTAMVVLTLALGIGANTAIFSVVNALLLRPLPYPAADRLMQLNHFYPSLNNLESWVSPFGFNEYSKRTASFDAVAAQSGGGGSLTGRGEPQRLAGSAVSAEWFRVFGVEPALGRTFAASETVPENDAVAILSDGLWQSLFGGDAGALGQSIVLNGRAHEVVGIMPPGFRDFYNASAQLWTPLALTTAQLEDPQGLTNEFLAVTVRQRPDVSAAMAAAELDRIAADFHEMAAGQLPAGWTIRLTSLEQRARGDIRPLLLLLLGAVGFVLLIACVNVANLLLARGAGRIREIAIRTALGATRRSIVRQLLVESVVIALIGGAVGLLVTFWTVSAIGGLVPPQLVGAAGIAVDPTVLLFTVALSLAAGLLFGVAPALDAVIRRDHDPLRSGGRGSTGSGALRLRRALVVSELALALTLLAGAGLLIRSFERVQNVDIGFQPDRLLAFDVALAAHAYPTQAQRMLFFDEALARFAAMPGISAVGATSLLPFSGNLSTRSFLIEGQTVEPGAPFPWGEFRLATEGYARAMGLLVRRGRFFTEQDRTGSLPVAVVDELLAQRYWPGADPIGQRVGFPAPEGQEPAWREVVGVVAHTKHDGFAGEDRVQLYMPARQATSLSFLTFVARTAGDPNLHVRTVRETIRAIDPDQPVHNITTMHELMHDSLAQRRLAMLVLAGFAALALVLAAVGIYGVMAQLVADRTRELGVRMALGATTRDVLALVLRQGVILTGLGIGFGVFGAVVLTRLLEGQLFGVTRVDPATYAAVIVVLGATALLATWLPARRAARTDPIGALRAE